MITLAKCNLSWTAQPNHLLTRSLFNLLSSKIGRILISWSKWRKTLLNKDRMFPWIDWSRKIGKGASLLNLQFQYFVDLVLWTYLGKGTPRESKYGWYGQLGCDKRINWWSEKTQENVVSRRKRIDQTKICQFLLQSWKRRNREPL